MFAVTQAAMVSEGNWPERSDSGATGNQFGVVVLPPGILSRPVNLIVQPDL